MTACCPDPALCKPADGHRITHPTPAFKRPFDLCLAFAMLVAAAPLFALCALAVAATSRGPVFFAQERVGLAGRRFRMLKFRSMYADAEARRAALEARSERKGVCFKMRDDPRITPVGRVLRRFSLDELPQLLNVLWGDMSLVGPRPALPAEVAAYSADARERLAALPGITGLWQVSGRADLDFDAMVALDLDYIRRCSPRTDLRILFHTVFAVIGGRGAY
jgi:lipopolysaccharide/colanic/teichoic acid biosynthesis glycosyltransferase